jgi:hypothetical protein
VCAVEGDWEGCVCIRRRVGCCVFNKRGLGLLCSLEGEWGFVCEVEGDWKGCVCIIRRLWSCVCNRRSLGELCVH